MKLKIELVPETCFFKNLRSEIPPATWDKLRKECYAKADNTCEICGGRGDKHPVECHEIWEYNDSTNTQILKGLIALCPQCHEVKHIGLAQLQGKFGQALSHLAEINNISIKEARSEVTKAFNVWGRRSKKNWTLDISWLNQKLQPAPIRSIYCCACRKDIEAYLTNGAEVYPHREDLKDIPFWKCPTCGNHVGCHVKTDKPTDPLGYIPTPVIAQWRRLIHAKMDPLWQSGAWTRRAVYAWMTQQLGWKFHISCLRTIKEAETAYLLLDRIPKTKEESDQTSIEMNRIFGEDVPL